MEHEPVVNILLVSLNPFLEKMMIANLLARDNKSIGKIFGGEENHDRTFDNEYFTHLDQYFGENQSRDVYSRRVDLVRVQDPVTLKRVVPEILKVVQIVVMDSHMQRLRVGVQPGTDWFSKNSLIIQMIEIVSQCKSIRKKLFLNYPFSVYQTRRSGAAKEIMNSVTLIKQSQPDFFEKKAKQICKDFKINSTVFYSSLVQVYLREQMAGEFFIVEVPYLIPGVKDFRGLYLPQFNVLDDIIIFMRDGMMDRIDAPYTALVPMVPVDIVCQFLLNNMLSSTAMINNFYGCPLRWTVFFYIVSDHFTVHSASNAYSGPEIRAQEVEGNTAKIKLIADRVPTFLTRRVKNYSLASFMKELRVTIKLSCTVESSTTLLTEEQWKYVVDCYIYGVRHHMLGDKTNTLAVYTKYGVLRNRYQIRKQSFMHFGLLKSKAQNIFEFSTNIFRDRILNCRKVQEAIQEDMSLYIEQNHGLTSDDIRQRKAAIELDLQQNLDLLSSHFKRIGVLTLMMACHYMFRKMFESINFDNKFVENVRNHDYRKGPIIFLPTHKSYMDFMILNYLLALRDARPPMIGAADNMNNIMILSKLFQLSGAFYIKRTGQKFPRVYRSVLNEFIKSILEHEMNLEFFVEATRSRSGQILFPKYGMLKYVIEAYVEKRVPDAILIPINITYENLIEADSYIGEHRGGQKVQENVLRLIKAVGLVFHNFGKLIINSAEPISLKRYMEERSEAGKPFATGNEDEFVQNLGLHLTDTLQQKSVFMHTHLICAILLMRLHYQLVKDVEVSVRLLGEEIKVRKGTLFEMEEHDFNFDSAIKCFKDRLSIRGDTLNERRVCIDRGNYIENCLALKYYANSMNYLFFLEALVHYSAAHQPALERTINLDVLWRKVSILQDMFSSEIYLSRWLENQSSMELYISQKKLSFIRPIDRDHVEFMIDLPINDILVIEFYNILIPPIFSGYMITFICIHSLASYDICPIEKTMLMIQKMSETAHLMGVIQTPTFCSIFYVRNAYQFLVSKGIVQESSKLKDNNIMKCFKVSNIQALEELVRSLRQDFLWEENYRIIRKVFEERFLAQNRSKDLQQRL